MRNHVKILTDEQIAALNDKFEFSEFEDYILVKNKNYTRTTKHLKDQGFTINSKIRKISFWPETIAIWLKLTNEFRLAITLPEVQKYTSTLYLMYQDLTSENVVKLMTTKNTKIKEQ